MSLDLFAPNDTTEREPRQEPYRRHEGWSVIAGTLPQITDGRDGFGAELPRHLAPTEALKAEYLHLCAQRSVINARIAEDRDEITRRINAAEKAVA